MQQEQTQNELTFTTAPNLLTLARIIFVPFVVGALFMRDPTWDIVASLLFGVAAATDFFDGYLARVQKSVTVYGKLMDPLADKFLVVSSVIMLQALGRIHPVVTMLLVCRELAITGLRALASAEGVVISASQSGKWKTAFQMIAIPFIMVNPGIWGIPLYDIGTWMLYVSLAISLWSAQDYAVDFFREFRSMRKLKIAKRQERRASRLAARQARRLAKGKNPSPTP